MNNRQVDRLNFKDLFRHVARHGLIDAGAVERWLGYRENRNDTAHDYGESFAETTLKLAASKHLPGVEAWACDSRVNGHSHDGSDLDLALRGPELEKIPVEQLADFKEAAQESSIPFQVEARDWARLAERFCREIERGHVVL